MIGGDYGAGALSVSELNEYARKLLATDPLLRALEVTGEISGYKHHYSGHRYFSLKDENARVQCVMFRQHALGLDFQPADGMRVTVRASASIYPQNGSFQLYVTSMRQAGQGDLFVRFEKLKQKLLAEGLFDPARKREIPAYPRVIGVVTSQTGAAIRDIIHVARRRNPNVGIVLSPCLVQGPEAAADIVRAMDRLNRARACDVMLVGRGGGSIEDLWAFNEEAVARAIFDCSTPVISAVGHETDVTIADFAADLRAPTPSAAAELAVYDAAAFLTDLAALKSRLDRDMRAASGNARLMLEQAARRLERRRPGQLVEEKRHALQRAQEALKTLMRDAAEGGRRELAWDRDRLQALMRRETDNRRHALQVAAASLEGRSPLRVLAGGWGYVTGPDGRQVKSVHDVQKNDRLGIRLADGRIAAQVTDTEEA